MSAKRLKGLNTLRFFAALLVVVFHAKEHLNDLNINFGNDLVVLLQGLAAVDVFFSLSGFLITYLALKEIDQRGSINFKFFYLRRIFRIMPLYYLVFFLMLFFLTIIASNLLNQDNILGFPALEGSVLYVFMLPNLVKPLWPNLVGGMNVFWSIGVEEQFYLLFPLIMYLFLKAKNKTVYFLTLFITFFAFYWLIIYEIIESNSIFIFFIKSLRFHYMIMGMFFAYIANIYLLKKENSRLQNLINKNWYQIISVSLVLAKFLFYHVENSLINDLICCLLFSNLILVVSHRTQGVLFKTDFKFISYLGTISYGIYLIHPLVSYFVRMLYLKVHLLNVIINKFPIVYVILLLSLTCVLAHFSFKYFESVFLRIKNKYR